MPLPSHCICRGAAVCLGIVAGLIIAECSLRVLGIPRFWKAHSAPTQFEISRDDETGRFFHINKPASAITFEYDSNPRGYFEPGNIVVHETNGSGFRGPKFALYKPDRTVRLAFFGDSFAFGEGVRRDDTFAEVTARLLERRFADRHLSFQSYNFGVGGYNTADELFLLKKITRQLRPDVVVVCYNLNDAEPSLFQVDPLQRLARRPREADDPEGLDQPTPPKNCFCSLRVVQVAWRVWANRQRTRQTEAYYRSLYRSDAEGWKTTQKALHEIVTICKREQLPLVVMIFPVLHRLYYNHPYKDLYAMIASEVKDGGGRTLNLFPAFQGNAAEKLWVHPTDQHPNEVAHRIAAEQLTENLVSYQDFLATIDEAVREKGEKGPELLVRQLSDAPTSNSPTK